jgi:hypothetical protein
LRAVFLTRNDGNRRSFGFAQARLFDCGRSQANGLRSGDSRDKSGRASRVSHFCQNRAEMGHPVLFRMTCCLDDDDGWMKSSRGGGKNAVESD